MSQGAGISLQESDLKQEEGAKRNTQANFVFFHLYEVPLCRKTEQLEPKMVAASS